MGVSYRKSNKLKHKALGIISSSLKEYLYNNEEPKAVSFDELSIMLKIPESIVKDVLLEIYEEKDATYYNINGIKGYFPNNKTLINYENKKYLKRNKDISRENRKYYVSVYLPIISLIISVYAIFYKVNLADSNNNSRLDRLEKQLEEVYNKQLLFQNNQYYIPKTTTHKSDSNTKQ